MFCIWASKTCLIVQPFMHAFFYVLNKQTIKRYYILQTWLKIEDTWGWPSGTVVKFAHSTSAAGVHRFGSRVQTWHCLSSNAVVGIPHTKQRKMGTDVSSGPIFLSKKRRIGSSCQLRASLPQQKRGGLAVVFSSGLIFLKKKKLRTQRRRSHLLIPQDLSLKRNRDTLTGSSQVVCSMLERSGETGSVDKKEIVHSGQAPQRKHAS